MKKARPPIRRTRAVLAYANRYLRVYDDEIRLPDGRPGRYLRLLPGEEFMEVPAVVALARNARGGVAFIHIYRYGLADWLLELPRGAGEVGETPSETGLRELAEETGLHGRSARQIGRLVSNSTYDGAYIAVVLIEGVDGDPRPQTDEGIAEVRWLAPSEIGGAIARGELADGISLAALAIAERVERVGQAP